jgi:hypothetical protein
MPRTLALPIALGRDGGLAALEQDSAPEVAQSVALLVDTRPGERTALPSYGLPDPVGGRLDVDALVDVVAQWEERADTTEVELLAAELAAQAAAVHPAPTSTEEA